jgi:3-oxoadipate enol-lactonase
MPFARAADLVVHYAVDGSPDAPVVMLANSLGTSFPMWDAQLLALARSHRVLRYDMRGHGLTDVTPSADTLAAGIERLADDAIALLDVLGLHRVAVVGLSIGGMVAQRVASRYPQRVEALVLCATTSRGGPPSVWDARIATVESDGVEAIVDATMGHWFTEHAHTNRPELVRGFANMVARTPLAGYVAGCRAVRDADLRADDARIKARTLIVAGAHDPTATPELGAELQAAIPGAQLEVLHAAAHLLCAEQPVAFNEKLLQFLEA